MNKAWISGNIVADAELKDVNVGGVQTPRCRFAVAVNEKKKNGEKIVNYFEVTLWSEYAKTMAPWLIKGRKVQVEGNVRLNKYQTAKEEMRYELQIANATVELSDKKPQENEPEAEPEELPF